MTQQPGNADSEARELWREATRGRTFSISETGERAALIAIAAALALRDDAYRAGGEKMREAALAGIREITVQESYFGNEPDWRGLIEDLIEALPPAQTEGAE